MAKLQIKGLDEYAEAITKMATGADEALREAVRAGGAVVADSIKSALKSLPVQEGDNGLPPYVSEGEKLTGVSRRQKADLIESFGLAPIEEKDGYINTKAGFDGYGSVPTKKYPNGVPNQMLMRSIESGTSFRKKSPVIRKAVTSCRKQAEEAMNRTMEAYFRKEMS